MNAPRPASPDTSETCAGSPKTISASAAMRAIMSRTPSRSPTDASAPIRERSSPGRPIAVWPSLSDSAAITARSWAAGTSTRRIAVHFCPAFEVISRCTSRTNRSNSGVPGPASGPRIAAFRLSASIVKRTEFSTIALWVRSLRPVWAEPVKVTTSCPVTWSSRSPTPPQTSCSAPSGRMPRSMIRRTTSSVR